MKYISLLRGINVSGQKKIKMSDLTVQYESLGFQNVITYIQSGNVIFDANDNNINNLTLTIEEKIKKEYQFYVPVEIRTKSDMMRIIKSNPFTPVDLTKDGTKVLVTFLSEKPKKDSLSNLLSYVNLPEKLIVKDKEVFLYCPNGYGKSKLSNTFIEKKLNVNATTRNWKSVLKLYELAM